MTQSIVASVELDNVVISLKDSVFAAYEVGKRVGSTPVMIGEGK